MENQGSSEKLYFSLKKHLETNMLKNITKKRLTHLYCKVNGFSIIEEVRSLLIHGKKKILKVIDLLSSILGHKDHE